MLNMTRFSVAALLLASFGATAHAAPAKLHGVRLAQATLESASTPTPAPTPFPLPVATPYKSVSKKQAEKLATELKKSCDRHYPGLIQGDLRSACTAPADDYYQFGKNGTSVNCRLNYGEEPREVMACLIGNEIADEIANGKEDFKRKLLLCAEHYPAHTEIDTFLQESCLTGINMTNVIGAASKSSTCSEISPERSFIGPCIVGWTLGKEGAAASNQMNRVCEQYFDHRRFHSGYRACLLGRSVEAESNMRVADILRGCASVVASDDSDTERAACFVGASIYQHNVKKEDITKRFQKCGDNKVSYQDRDYLACLTAASLLSVTDKNGADNGCRDIFKGGNSRSRSDCVNSIGLF